MLLQFVYSHEIQLLYLYTIHNPPQNSTAGAFMLPGTAERWPYI